MIVTPNTKKFWIHFQDWEFEVRYEINSSNPDFVDGYVCGVDCYFCTKTIYGFEKVKKIAEGMLTAWFKIHQRTSNTLK